MDLIQTLFSNVWAGILVIFFFGGSIFVHELGHFLAARRRKMHVERFSIGFGPKIVSWEGKDGVEYRLSWLPLGGYVALPELADMRAIEGQSKSDISNRPPPSYVTKVIVSVAGAAFNVLFAFVLACIIWLIGIPESGDLSSNRLGYISPTLKLSNNAEVPSPASLAHLQVGDRVLAIDGKKVSGWTDIQTFVGLGASRSPDGRRTAVFTIERDGKSQDVVLYPEIAGEENDRRVGISPGYPLLIGKVTSNSPAAAAGFKQGDEILSVNGLKILNAYPFEQALIGNPDHKVSVVVRRLVEGKADGPAQELTLELPSVKKTADIETLGLNFTTLISMSHPSPFEQIAGHALMMYRSLVSLINPHSDVGPSKMVSPVGIIRIYFSAAESGIRSVLWLTILININLALFNLLPIPVLDGGHILFATVAKLRGKPLPIELVATVQSVFMVLLLSFVLYVGFFDFRRIAREHRPDTEDVAPAAQNTNPAPQAPAPSPVSP